ncbi:MAG: DUF3352 domain-containing protein [Anaerolineae bacterium]|nr:DUF3352 domain-containing protein [Anaerolineae bacterium]
MKRAAVLFMILAVLSLSAPALAAPPAGAPVDPGADLIPAGYDGFINLAGRDLPAHLAKLRALLGLGADASASMQGITDAIFPGAGVSYANDIAPWLGEHITIGFRLDDENDFVALAATTDTARSDAFVQKVSPALAGGAITITALEGYVAYGAVEGIRQVVSVMSGEAAALAEAPGVQQVFSRLPVDRFAAAYVDGEAVTHLLLASGIDSGMVLGDNALTGIGFAASSPADNPEAARFDVALGFSEPVPAPVPSTAALGSLVEKAVPADALGLFTAYDLRVPVRAGLYAFALQTYVQDGMEAAAKGEPLPKMPTQSQSASMADSLLATGSLMLRSTGLQISLEQDVLDWLSGEYALGLLPNPAGLWGAPSIPVDGFAMTQIIDRNATMNIVEILSRVLASQFELTLNLVNIGGYDLRAVPDTASGGNLFIFGMVGDFLVVATGDSIQQLVDVASGSAPNLAGSAAWQARARSVEPGSEALLYVPASETLNTLSEGMTAPYDFAMLSVDVVEESKLVIVSALVVAR